MNDTSAPQRLPHPVAFDVAYPERLSRLSTFFRLLLAIPQLIVVWLLSTVLLFITFIAWFGILFTGRYPKSFFEFSSGMLRWQANVYAYVALLRDEYPPFSWEPGEYPLALTIDRAERQSRFRLFIRFFAVIPNYIVLYFVQIAWFVTTIFSWFAILVTGRYPRGLFKFAVGVLRWMQRQFAYLYLLRDEYPPYSVKADARPGNEWVSAIIGLPIGVLYVAFSLIPAFQGGTTVDVSYALLDSPSALAREDVSGASSNVRITLLEYQEDVRPPLDTVIAGTRPIPAFGDSWVMFRVRAEKDGWTPWFYTPALFQLESCSIDTIYVASPAVPDGERIFDFYFTGGSTTSTLYFAVPREHTPCRLTYFTGRSDVRFDFVP